MMNDIKKKIKNKALHFQYSFWNIFLGLTFRFFKNEISILVFVELAIFLSM